MLPFAASTGTIEIEELLLKALLRFTALMLLVVRPLMIPDSVYCMLALMALVTTFMTTPLVLNSARSTELERFIRQSKFGVQ